MRRRTTRTVLCVIALALGTSPSRAADKAGTAESKGLAVAVKPAKDQFPRTETLAFDVTLKNTSNKPFQLFDADFWMYDVNTPKGTWHCVLEDVAGKRHYKPSVIVRPMIARLLRPAVLQPGKLHTTQVRLGRGLHYAAVNGPKLQPGPRLNLRGTPLPDGRYRLLLTLKFRTAPSARPKPAPAKPPFWLGTLKLATAAFQVGAVAAKPVAAGWRKLFADQRWYKTRRGDEQEFTGVLKAKPKPRPGEIVASTLQRECYYFLGEWRVYTGARRHAALETLAGKKVVIRGKAVEMDLEGQHLKELWPAAVRLATDAKKPDAER